MASSQNQPPNVDLFDVYFRRADLDRDGRISGQEAVSFFQGSGLSKQVLAQIWAYADPRQAGFLGRAEFYNALKLVTVAQSKRELTPEIVRAALYGPAATKIPPPQINLAATPQPLPGTAPVATATQSSSVTPTVSQNLGFGGPQVNASVNQHLSQESQLVKPPLPASASPSQPSQGVAAQGVPRGGAVAGPRLPSPSLSSDWAGGSTVVAATGTSSQAQNKGTTSSMGLDVFGLATLGPTTALPPRPQPTSGLKPSGPPAKDAKEVNISANGFAFDSSFGGDVFSVTPSQPKQDGSVHAFSARNLPVSPALVPNSAGSQPSLRPTALDSMQSIPVTQTAGVQFQPAQSLVKPNNEVSAPTTSTSNPGISLTANNSAAGQSQIPWPKMTQTNVQNYTKVFVEVDTDRDGKITGEQARDLFLSWKLPREVLKQVWDLSDQDNDSMLSLREFCIALYLMERYREGRPLPAALPSNVIFDVSSSVPPTANYSNAGNAAWRPSGFPQQPVIPSHGARHMMPPVGPRPPVPVAVPQADEEPPVNQPKSRVPELDKHLIDQLSAEEQNSLNSKFKEATEADKKVEELEKEIMESREKIDFYRSKMQELVLYKSRCDNRLNEIMERSSADKREVESLARKYEEKYRQTGDVASKLTIEEATFRDIQEKKMELYQAIVKMEQDGSADGVLQVRVDRIQSDLDELVKSLNERCKKYGLRGKPITLTELPFGWQPGIQEEAADWDDDWDKLEDEEFTFVKELTLDVQNVTAPPKQKSTLSQYKEPSVVESPRASASPDLDVKSDKPESVDGRVVENGSAHNKSEDLAKSAPNSPIGSSAVGSPSGEFSDSNFGKAFDSASPRDKETQSDHGGARSLFSGDKSFDEPAWGHFDTNDDLDSVWDFNSISTTKDKDHERNGDNYFFGSAEFGLNPIRTGSPQAGTSSQNSQRFIFDDSVPSTPLYNIGNSPPGFRESSQPSFDSFSRYDSFSTHDSGFFPPKDTFARFDSMRSSRDFDQGHGFPSFDESDPFGSSGPFRTSLDSQTPRKGSDSWSAF
ncbi:Parvalbumin [Trema orientale]|uniref:Parvalbumin n=1 Tax=Trema orientale TaxID=63057 RepID=A0A2P5EWI7_TREOI|nr:Parvalbumin [Trema orientale]